VFSFFIERGIEVRDWWMGGSSQLRRAIRSRGDELESRKGWWMWWRSGACGGGSGQHGCDSISGFWLGW